MVNLKSSNKSLEKDFSDIKGYCYRMAKSVIDKVFFLERLEDIDVPITIIDYGCADGEVLRAIHHWAIQQKKYITLVGYDKNEEMLEMARRHDDICPNIIYTSNYDEVKQYMDDACYSVLVLSSVIHEVYSYGDPLDVMDFWLKVFNSNVNMIAIRDMMYESTNENVPIYYLTKILRNLDEDRWQNEFMIKWGTLLNRKNFIHYLLKYQYKKNWVRELNENYLPLSADDFLNIVEDYGDKYKVVYFHQFILPYLKQQIQKDFEFDMPYDTHFKCILMRKDTE